MGDYYCYRYLVHDKNGRQGIYVGQSRSYLRVLSHLSSSSDKKLNGLLSEADTWPLIQVFRLPLRCMGDLTLMESALINEIQLEIPALPVQNREMLNGREEQGTRWFATPTEANRIEYAQKLDSALLPGQLHELRSWEYCHGENLKATNDALQKATSASKDPVEAQDTMGILPSFGTAITRHSWGGLAAVLKKRGVDSALVVFVNGDELADGRIPFSPSATEAANSMAIATRGLRYWPVSDTRRPTVSQRFPRAVIAVTGSKEFRIIIGAWPVVQDQESLTHGVWQVDETSKDPGLRDLVGQLLDSSIEFRQSSYPIFQLSTHNGQAIWCGGNGSHAITAAQDSFETERSAGATR